MRYDWLLHPLEADIQARPHGVSWGCIHNPQCMHLEAANRNAKCIDSTQLPTISPLVIPVADTTFMKNRILFTPERRNSTPRAYSNT
jgi:hypothetical protein